MCVVCSALCFLAGSDESYFVCVRAFLIVCDLETSKRDGLGLTSAVASQKKKLSYSPLISSFKRNALGLPILGET